MRNIDNFLVVDISSFDERIEKLKMLRNKAIEEKSFETAQWIEGKITTIKEIIGDSTPLEVIVSDVFDVATTGMHFGYDNSKDKEEYIKNFTIHQIK